MKWGMTTLLLILTFVILWLTMAHQMISRENAELPISARELRPSTMRPHTTLSGLNCTLEAGIMSVKTTEIWDSRVVKVMKQ